MTTQQMIDDLMVRRDRQRQCQNIKVKDEVRAIQSKMVEISFLPEPDLQQHRLLVAQLNAAKLKLL